MHKDYWIGVWKQIPLFDCVDRFVIPCVGKSLEFHENPVFLNSLSLSVAVISIKNHAIEVPKQKRRIPIFSHVGFDVRVSSMEEGAKSIAVGGEFPTTVSSLRKVRGTGDYTAGAIASIAFKEVVPVVDGNVIRAISRLKAISANPKESTTVKSFWKLAGQLVDPSRHGDFNQALMELGATVCTPLSPSCSACPISDQCHAMSVSKNCQTVRVTDFPVKVAKAKQRYDFAAVCVIEITDCKDPEFWKAHSENSAFLLVKRPDEGLLAGLWEFPSVVFVGCGDECCCLHALVCEIRVGCLFVGFLQMLVKVFERLR